MDPRMNCRRVQRQVRLIVWGTIGFALALGMIVSFICQVVQP